MAFELPQFLQDQERSTQVLRQIEKLRKVVIQLNEVKIDVNVIYSEITSDVDSDQDLIDLATSFNNGMNGTTYNDFITWLDGVVN